VQPVSVFSQAAIANLAIVKDLLDVSDGMFHFGPGAGFKLLSLQLAGIHISARAGAFGNEPKDVLTIFMLIPLLNSRITRITEHASLVTVEKVASGYDVVDVGCGG